MKELFILFLFVLGTLFGSFASVLIYRLKTGEKGIINGRSHCSSCQRILGALDLIPVFSFLLQKGRCKVCQNKISHIYPLLECSMGLVFALVGWKLADIQGIFSGNPLSLLELTFLLFISFITIVYTFYDILFMEIPESVLGVGNVGVVLFGACMTCIAVFSGSTNFSWELVFAVLLGCTVLAGLYVILLRELDTWYDILILGFLGMILLGFAQTNSYGILHYSIVSGALGAYGLFVFFYLQILVSGGKWMGGGDLRIAIFIGYILGVYLVFPAVLLTYIVGSVVGVGYIFYKKYIQKVSGKIDTMIPFGPFLAFGMLYTMLFGSILQFFPL